MNRVIFILISFFCYSLLSAQQLDTLFLLQTTDVHGNIYPYNYFKDQPASYGLAKIHTRVAEYRRTHKNVVLLDAGDLLQGTPLVYYFNVIENTALNPMIMVMNMMGYDAFAVGNHDIEQGPLVYNKARSESKFPWLSANSALNNGQTYFKPYTIIERNGIRIGVIGLTTPGIPMWLDESLYPGITWKDMVESAKKYVPVLRPQVDILVGLFHAGFNEGYSAAQTERIGLPNENASRLVARQVPGFDVVFAGHSHREVGRRMEEVRSEKEEGRSSVKRGAKSERREANSEKRETNRDVLLINAGAWGRNLGVAEIILRKRIKEKRQKIKGRAWEIIEKNGWLESMEDVQASPKILNLTKEYHEKTLKYIRTEIAQIDGVLDTRNSRFEDNAVVELINKAQMDITGADISFAASFNDRLVVDSGELTIKDIYGIYPYENFLYVVEMTGQQIKDFLEHAARYYILDNGKIRANLKVNGYNYDMAEGISYKIEVKNRKANQGDGRPESGKREAESEEREVKSDKGKAGYRRTMTEKMNKVENIILLKTSKPLEMGKKYKVAMNSYRAAGGGGHMAAANAENAKIIWKSSTEMRNILAEYFKKLGVIKVDVDGNWEIVIN